MHKNISEPLRSLSTSEVMAALGCCKDTVYMLQDKGLLPFFWVGARKRVRETDLIAFMEKGGATQVDMAGGAQ